MPKCPKDRLPNVKGILILCSIGVEGCHANLQIVGSFDCAALKSLAVDEDTLICAQVRYFVCEGAYMILCGPPATTPTFKQDCSSIRRMNGDIDLIIISIFTKRCSTSLHLVISKLVAQIMQNSAHRLLVQITFLAHNRSPRYPYDIRGPTIPRGGRYPFASGTGAGSCVPSCACAGAGEGRGRTIL